MKTIQLFLITAAITLVSCEKTTRAPFAPEATSGIDNGPYGIVSHWKCFGGDSVFEKELTLTLFYTEKHSPCDICHYEQNYALWDDYSYTYSVSKCTVPNDTLIMVDIATAKKAFFKRVKD